jgi:hypothetical protein
MVASSPGGHVGLAGGGVWSESATRWGHWPQERVARGLGRESAPAPLSLVGQLLGILGAIMQILLLPMLDTGQDPAHGRTIASQLFCDHHA